MSNFFGNFFFFSLGLCYKKMGKYEDAMDCFHKLHLMLPSSAEVLCQLGSVYLFQLRFLQYRLMLYSQLLIVSYRNQPIDLQSKSTSWFLMSGKQFVNRLIYGFVSLYLQVHCEGNTFHLLYINFNRKLLIKLTMVLLDRC